MKNLVFVFGMLFLGLVSCKNDSAATTEGDATDTTTLSETVPASPSTPAATTTEGTPAVPTGPITKIEFEEEVFDFGEVMDGDKVKHEYKFKNTGTEPLIISNAKGSCGCTVPSWPREPIPAGEEGVIMVQFDSKNKGKVGGSPQSKRVTLTANTDPVNTYLTIKGTVKKEDTGENPS